MANSNVLLVKSGSDSLYLNKAANGFTYNGKEVLIQDKAGTLALKADCLASVGDGLQVDSDNKVSAKIKSGEKALAASSEGLSTTLGLKWDKTTTKVQLTGISGAVISEFDAADFVRDGMLDSVNLSSEGGKEYMVFTWNTDAGKQTLPVDVTKFVDVYTAGDGLKLSSGNEFSVDFDVVAKSETLSGYLTKTDAASTYETKTDAASTFATKTDLAAVSKALSDESVKWSEEGTLDVVYRLVKKMAAAMGATITD